MQKKRTGRRFMTIACLAAAAGALAFQAAPVSAKDELVPHIVKGRVAFEAVCGRCHGIDKPEKKNMDRTAWDELITSMEAKGAKMTAEERELILDYLGLRNVFLSKCTVCHTAERVLDRNQAFRGWGKTVERMVAKGPDLMTEGEARSITAYLTVIRGVAPAAE